MIVVGRHVPDQIDLPGQVLAHRIFAVLSAVTRRQEDVIGGVDRARHSDEIVEEGADLPRLRRAGHEPLEALDAAQREEGCCRLDRARDSEALSGSVLNNTGDCVLVLDPEGRIIYMNPPGVSALQFDSLDAVKGRRWSDLWPPDLRGHGQSVKSNDHNDYRLDTFAADIAALCKHCWGALGFSLIGYSMGAHVAMSVALASADRVESLILGGMGDRIADDA